MHILIADDDKNLGFVLKTELETESCTVDLVRDGVEAVMAFLNNGYDAVLLDVSMPCLDGINALKIMKRLKPGFFAVVFSGSAVMVDSQVREALGGNGAVFFQKPFEIKKIKDLIQTLKGSEEGESH